MAHCLVWPNATIVPPWSHRHPTSFEGRSALSCFTRGLVFFCAELTSLLQTAHSNARKAFWVGCRCCCIPTTGVDDTLRLRLRSATFFLLQRDQAESRRQTSPTCRGCSGEC